MDARNELAMGNTEALREKRRARQWVRNLGLDQIHALIDAMVLGDFDWREWGFEDRPSGVFTSAAFDEAQYREELEVVW